MPFDWQSFMSMLRGGQLGGPMSGTQQGAPTGQPLQPVNQLVPGSTGQPPADPASQGLFGAMGLGPQMGMGLTGAGLGLLQASGPSRVPTSMAQGLGGGLAGFLGGARTGMQLDQEQQQANALRQMSQVLQQPQQGKGTPAAPGQGRPPLTFPNSPTLPAGSQAVPSFMRSAVQTANAALPGATGVGILPSTPAMPAMAGGTPFGGQMPAGGMAQMNPYIQMMMARRQQFGG